MTKETFKMELTLVDGQITHIKPFDDLHVSEEVKELNQFFKKNPEIMDSIKHGPLMLTGQNSPGWIIFRTAFGYIRIWR